MRLLYHITLATAIVTCIANCGNNEKQQLAAWNKETVIPYITGRSNRGSEWWLIKAPRPEISSEQGEERIVRALHHKKSKIKEYLAKYRSTSPKAEQIASAFGEFTISIDIGSETLSLLFINDPFLTPLADDVEICFVPYEHFQRDAPRFYYDQDWATVMLSALRLPEPLEAAIIFRVLGHAMVARSHDAMIPSHFLLQSESEIEMFELAGAILNQATEGKFYQKLDQMAQKQGKTIYESIFLVTATDLFEIDRIIGGEAGGSEYAFSVFLDTIPIYAFRLIDHYSINEKARLRRKVKFIRWFASLTIG